jgi:hypothetical protein
MFYDKDTGGSLEKNPLLNEVYAYFMGNKSTRNGIYMCGQEDKICVDLVNVVNICVTNNHGYVSFVVIIILSFIHDFSQGL